MTPQEEDARRALGGPKLYHARARAALPLLVRQAEAGQTISYGRLAEELGIPNPRTLKDPLGAVGNALASLSEGWGRKVPPLQCVVVNKRTGLPGAGIGWFVEDPERFRKLPPARQRAVLRAELNEVFAFDRWEEVLGALGLEPAPPVDRGSLERAGRYRGGGRGEGERHRRLKELVVRRPDLLLGLRKVREAETERVLPSGDRLDVFFEAEDGSWHAAEVKGADSPEEDLRRGLFQCVKYRALMEAVRAARALAPFGAVRAVLVLEGRLPASLVPLRNTLGVEVVENAR